MLYPGLCQRRGWHDPMFEVRRGSSGFTCLVLVNGREYQTDQPYKTDQLAQENAAMRAFMVCRNFSINGGMLARNGVVQGLPVAESGHRRKERRGGRASTIVATRQSPTPSNSSTSSGGYEYY